MTDERYFFFDKRYAALRDVPFLPAPGDTPCLVHWGQVTLHQLGAE